MPDFNEKSRSAWSALWKTGGAYDLRSAMRSGTRKGLVWFRPLKAVTFPPTGPLVLYNREPWGVVSVDFSKNEVSQFHTIETEGIELTGEKFTAKIKFTELKLAGDYIVRRGIATGSAVKLATSQLRFSVANTDPNIQLANAYQQQLIQSPTGSGRFMVGTYYDNNEGYVQAFQNTQLVKAWNGTTYKTNGKNTAYFAGVTSNAAQPGNTTTVQVNSDPDYNIHSWAMQNFVTVTCTKQGNKAAALAASTFAGNVGPVAKTPQTVSQVLNTVQSTPPPSSPQQALRSAPGWDEPWMPEVREKIQPIIDAIEKEEDDVQRGILNREDTERPIYGQYNAYFPTGTMTLTGIVSGENYECTGLSGPTPEVNIRLGRFPGKLHAELQAELDKAGFLKAVLGKKAISALSTPAFLQYISRMLTLAAGEKLGSVNS